MPARQRQTLRYFYPRSPCGERLCNMHSLRYCCTNFYPRSPCGERPRSGRPCRAVHKFLSTLSLRRATGGRRAIDPETGISIHALLAESDFMQQLFAMQQQAFLSTLSLRRATYRLLRLPHRQAISIHALLAESDFGLQNRKKWHNNFYPRSPCGERLCDLGAAAIIHKFLSTLSLRRATRAQGTDCRCVYISIHALLAESDSTRKSAARAALAISIHALLAESDR